MPLWLAAARAIHYGACTGLFGLSLFQLYDHHPPRVRAWLTVLGAIALVSGAAWFALVTLELAGSLDRPAIAAVVTQTSFGPVWLSRLALALAASLYGGLSARGPRGALGLLCALLLASIALTGHTQSHTGVLRAVHVAADAVHLLGAGAWIGGLLGLSLTLTSQTDSAAVTVARFSRMAYVAVGLIAVSGLINAAILVASPAALVTTGYGRLLLVKLALVAAMLGFAAYNRLILSPSLSGPDRGGAAGRLRRNALAEQLLAAGVLICVACLGMGQPPA